MSNNKNNKNNNTKEEEQPSGDDCDEELYCDAKEEEEQSDAFTFTSTQKDSMMDMDSTEWPSLLPGIASPNPSITSWEMVSPSAQQQNHTPSYHQNQQQQHSPTNRLPPPASVPALNDESLIEYDSTDDAVVVDLPPKQLPTVTTSTTSTTATATLGRQRSFSTPDFIHLERMSEHLHDDGSISDPHDHDDDDHHHHDHEDHNDHFANEHDSHRTYPPQTRTTAPTTTNVWNRVSFRDIVLSQVHGLADEVVDPHQPSPQQHNMTLSNNSKPRPRFVVTAAPNLTTMQRRRGRQYDSTPNLRSSLSLDENLILGETDAMEFYHRKAKGFVGHKNGLRMRPDEAKRKDITMYKKGLQRQTIAS